MNGCTAWFADKDFTTDWGSWNRVPWGRGIHRGHPIAVVGAAIITSVKSSVFA
jgi:hypothetical protein